MKKPKWEWAILFSIIVLLYLSMFTPLSMISIFMMMVPVIILYVRTTVKIFILLFVLSNFIFSLLFITYAPVLSLFSLFFLLPSIVMGYHFKKSSPAETIISSGTMMLILQTLAIFMLIYMNGVDLIEGFKQYLTNYFNSMSEQFKTILSINQSEQIVNVIIKLIPFYLIAFSAIYVFITYIITKPILKKLGLDVKNLRVFRDWRLPKLIVGLYMITLFSNLIVWFDSESIWSTIFLNLLPLLTIVFLIQAFSFIFLVFFVKKWSKVIASLSVLLAFITPITLLLILLGIIDVLFPIRERIKNN